MIEYWIWLTQREHFGAKGCLRLLMDFGTPEAVFSADRDALSRIDGLTAPQVESLLDKDLTAARKTLQLCFEKGIQIVTLHEKNYPAVLRAIDDPPTVLYYLGKLPEFEDRPVIGIVGSRNASAYGCATAERLGYELGCGGCTVVSGLAKGIDAAATRGALKSTDRVVAVLGCGVERIYPRENADLYRALCERGCILSEYPPETPPVPENFPPRNRIISGLSDGVLVVEAAKKSGSLITAERALEQNRDVFAVPGNIGNPACEGTNRLLQNGAFLVQSAQDVLSAYEYRYPQTISSAKASAPKPEKPIDIDIPINYIDLKEIPKDLPEDALAVLLALGTDTLAMDDLIAASGLSAGTAIGAVTMLEVKGLVQRLAGKRFRRL